MNKIASFVLIIAAFFALSTADEPKLYKFPELDKDLNVTKFIFEVESIKFKGPNAKEATEHKKAELATGQLDLDLKNTTNQEFTVNVGKDESVTFKFLADQITNATTYHLEQVDYVFQNNGSSFNVINPNLRLTENKFKPYKQGYKCGNLKLTLLGDGNSTAELELVNFKFTAFHDGKAKVQYLECRGEPGSSVIPLAVGGGLLVFMGVALVVYLFMRNRAS